MESKGTNRRDFIKMTATGVAAAGLASTGTLIEPLVDPEKVIALEDIAKDNYREPVYEPIQITVNGHHHEILVDTRESLADVLRNRLNLLGTKVSCDHSECGACTVLMDDLPIYSCSTLATKANGHNILTIEGVSNGETLHEIQQKFYDKDAYQCGFCTSGQIMALLGFLKQHPDATEEDLKESNAGNLCRCGAYPNIHKVVLELAKK